MSLQPKLSPHYDNILVLSKEGRPLCPADNKKANWYLVRGLATELSPLPGYERMIQLTFNAKGNGTKFLKPLKNECVVCGEKKDISVHHVLPYCIKRLFPPEIKNHSHQWCVLVCETHHLAAESLAREIYEPYLRKAQTQIKNEAFGRANCAMCDLAGYKRAKELGYTSYNEDKVKKLLERSLIFKNIEEVPLDIKTELFDVSEIANTINKAWLLRLIRDCGGIEGTKRVFREQFMKLEPKFLPEGWLTDEEKKET